MNTTRDDNFSPYWAGESDWLCSVVMLPEDGDERLQQLAWIGRVFAFAVETNTRMLALWGDPGGTAVELLFSFSGPEDKDRFMDHIREDEYADPDEEGEFIVPARDEVDEAKPIDQVFRQDDLKYIMEIAGVTSAEFSPWNPQA